jgi:hypothetical protein
MVASGSMAEAAEAVSRVAMAGSSSFFMRRWAGGGGILSRWLMIIDWKL